MAYRRRCTNAMAVSLPIVAMVAPLVSLTQWPTLSSEASLPHDLSGHLRYRILHGSTAETSVAPPRRNIALLPRCQASSLGPRFRLRTRSARLPRPTMEVAHRLLPHSFPMPVALRTGGVRAGARLSRHGRQIHILSLLVLTHSFSLQLRTPLGRRWSRLGPATTPLTRTTRKIVCMGCSAVLTPTTVLGMTSPRTSPARRQRGRHRMTRRRLRMQ